MQRLSKGGAMPRLPPITLKSDADDGRRRTSRETAFSPSHARQRANEVSPQSPPQRAP